MNIPANHRMKYTFIFPTQDEAIKAGEDLLKEGFMFEGEGQYYKGLIDFQLGYDDTIHKMMSKIEVVEVVKSKKKERKNRLTLVR